MLYDLPDLNNEIPSVQGIDDGKIDEIQKPIMDSGFEFEIFIRYVLMCRYTCRIFSINIGAHDVACCVSHVSLLSFLVVSATK